MRVLAQTPWSLSYRCVISSSIDLEIDSLVECQDWTKHIELFKALSLDLLLWKAGLPSCYLFTYWALLETRVTSIQFYDFCRKGAEKDANIYNQNVGFGFSLDESDSFFRPAHRELLQQREGNHQADWRRLTEERGKPSIDASVGLGIRNSFCFWKGISPIIYSEIGVH